MRGKVLPEIPTPTFWVLPLGFVLHDGEELVTMSGWIARHQDELQRLSALSPITRLLVDTVPSSRTEVAVTIGLELAVLVMATSLAARRPHRRALLYIYSALLGVFVVHGVTHALQVVVFGGYVPGVISAVIVIPAVGVIVYRRLFGSGALTPRAALAAMLAGVVVFLPLFAAFTRIARGVDRWLQ